MVRKLSVLPLKRLSKADVDIAGGKGANLGEMIQTGLPVPDGFVVTAYAYFDFIKTSGLEDKIQAILNKTNLDDVSQLNHAAEQIQRLILKAKFPPQLAVLILRHYHDLSPRPDELVKTAVRSSATAEDLPEASFAGQQATFLNVAGEKALIEAVQKCWASLFTPRAIYYRQTSGFGHKKVGIAVVVQRMVQPRSSGVMFTINPVTNDKNQIIIEAIFGLGELIVQGSVVPDHFVVDKRQFKVIKRLKGSQDKEMVYDAKGGNLIKKLSPTRRQKYKISSTEAVKIAKLGRRLENHYLKPQDVEWSIDKDDKIYIIQTRPITTIGQVEARLSETATVLGRPDLTGSAASPGVGEGPARRVENAKQAQAFQTGEVLVAKMTSPDLVPIMKKSAAILTQEGGLTSHAAIVSRELGKPCVVGVEGLLSKVKDGDYLTVDANQGYIYLGHKNIKTGPSSLTQPSSDLAKLKTKTKIYVNLSDPDLADKVAARRVDGVGLLRAEFMITNQFKLHPKKLIKTGKQRLFVDKMAANLQRFAKAFYPRPVVYRATDFKTNEYRQMEGGAEFEPQEANPMIGWRGAARYISDGSIFQLELKALKKVRQAGLTNLHLMIPFVRQVEEVQAVKQILSEHQLIPSQHFWLWIMVEVPSMVILIDKLMQSGIQGVSIGTNDLTMLTLGVDRDSHEVAPLYSELDEAVLWSVKRVIKAGRKHGVTVSVCGQAPSVYQEFTEKLIKWGVDSVSVSPDRIEATRQLVHQIETKLAASRHV